MNVHIQQIAAASLNSSSMCRLVLDCRLQNCMVVAWFSVQVVSQYFSISTVGNLSAFTMISHYVNRN